MAQYKISDITNVYWAANDGFKAGRDPMGIQNSSIATYGRLLPGMTNLTGHIRYYSLYCWLLNEYDQLEQEGEINIHQYNFIRRAELIMAFIMNGQDVRAVVGANFVRDKSDAILYDDIYNIGEGADYENETKYWAFRSGAFGQYYLGSLIHYSLVKMEEGRFYLRNKGKQLAKTVEKSVPKSVRELYLDCIIEGGLSEEEMEELQPMGLHSIIQNSEEWTMLNHLLIMPDDDSSTLRRETTYLMLSDFDNGIFLQDFVEHRFLDYQKGGCCCQNAAFGWYFYYLCETFHYCIETIFCFILKTIDELQNPPIEKLIEYSVDNVMSLLEEEELYTNIEEWAKECTQSIDEQIADVKDAVSSQEYAQATKKAFVLCLRLYNELKDNEDEIIEFEKNNNLYSQRGIFREGLNEYVKRHLTLTPKAYIRTVVRQVMNEHTFVAINKMGSSDVDLRKFIFDNGRVILVEVRYPNQTNPRIESLRNFLVDLGYITEDGELTDIANQFMNDYGKE